MSPTAILDESITSDSTTVLTNYTSCNRYRVAVEHSYNPTEIALAELYAHIHTMPESANKRRLIKKFNKENGKGTPTLHHLMKSASSSVTKSGKSLGNSIKKHNFIKSLISKNPKSNNQRNSDSNSGACGSSSSKMTDGPDGGYDTPIRSKATSQLKMRVLFQSPIDDAGSTSSSSLAANNMTPTTSNNPQTNGR